MIKQKTLINGSDYTNALNLTVSKSTSDNNTVSNFTATYDSPYGRHKNNFAVGQEIIIYADSDIIRTLGSPTEQFIFNEGSGTNVSGTMNMYNATMRNATWVPGKIGSAIYCNGSNSYARFYDAGSMLASNCNWTVMAWVNYLGSGNTPSGTDNPIIAGRFGDNTALFIDSSMKINLRMDDRTVISTQSIGSRTWNHIAASFKSGVSAGVWNAKLYLNGELLKDENNTWANVNYSNVGSIYIGYENRGARNWNGYIDDVRIYMGSILNTSQVYEIYNAGSGTEIITNNNQKLFTGVVENVTFTGEGLNERVDLRGRDYSIRLVDNNVQPVVYTNMEIGSIVNDILKNNTTDIGSSTVQHPNITLKRIAFKQPPINDALKQLADLSDYAYYVDNDKNLHFEPAGSSYSGYTFYSGNTIGMIFDKTREGMANQIWVYGDRQLAAAPTFNIGVGSPSGTAIGMGSVFTLPDKPSNTQVSISGSIRIGGVYQMQTYPTSGTVYLVNYEDRQLVFPSGADYGYYLPASGGSIIVNYDRSLPIAKYGENSVSRTIYGPKSLVVTDKSIKDPNIATSLVNYYIGLADPLNNIECDLKGWFTFTPGQTANLIMPNFGLNLNQIPIIEATYNFMPDTMMEEKVIRVKLDNRQIDITDQIRDLSQRLDALEAADKDSTDIITRIQAYTGSMLIVGSVWSIKQQFNGSEFKIWDSSGHARASGGITILGLLNSGAGLGTGSMSYLASGVLGTGWQTIRSGGYY